MNVEAGMAAGDQIEDAGAGNAARDLGDDVARQIAGGKTPAGPQAHRNGRIEMTARNMADGEGHGQHGQAEGERHADKSDTQLRESRGQHRRAAAAQHQPCRADELGCQFAHHDLVPTLHARKV